ASARAASIGSMKPIDAPPSTTSIISAASAATSASSTRARRRTVRREGDAPVMGASLPQPAGAPLLARDLAIALEQPRPAAFRREAGPSRVGAGAVALEAPMLERHGRAASGLGVEAHLDLGHERRVELPLRVELPAQHEAVRRLPDQHAAPVGLAAVLAALVPAAADAR